MIDADNAAIGASYAKAAGAPQFAHGGDISSLYFHLSKASVAEGDKVKQGSKIGLAGHTGRTTGPHLHLSIHVSGGMVDPASFIKLPIYARMERAAQAGGQISGVILPSVSTSTERK